MDEFVDAPTVTVSRSSPNKSVASETSFMRDPESPDVTLNVQTRGITRSPSPMGDRTPVKRKTPRSRQASLVPERE